MASGSNLHMLSNLGEHRQGSSDNLVDSLQSELELMLQARRKQLLRNRETDLDMYRSGSAPPTIQGSLRAVGGLFGDSNFGDFNSVSDGTGDNLILTEDEIRSHLPYLSYYYSHENINPRLPPPLLSKEDWRAVQRFRATASSGDLWRKKFSGDGDSSSLFAIQPGLSLPELENNLVESRTVNLHKNGGLTSPDWLGRGSDAPLGAQAFGMGSRRKSFANILQEGLDRSAPLSGQLSHPASHNALGDIVNKIGISDPHSSTLSNGIDVLDSLRSRAAPPGFAGGQGHDSTISHSFASAVGSSLSRSATPEQKLLGRSNSPVLPSVGSRIGPLEMKNVAGVTVQNGHHDGISDVNELAAALSGMNLPLTGQFDENVHTHGKLPMDVDNQQEFLFNTSNRKSLQQQLTGQSNVDNLSFPATYNDVARKNGVTQQCNISRINSNGDINFPRRNSHTNLRSAFSSSSLGSLDGSNGHLQNANFPNMDLISNGQGSSLDGSGIALNLNRLEDKVRSNLYSQIMDPNYLKYLERASCYGTCSAAISSGNHAKTYFSGALEGLDGIEKVYFETLLAQKQQQYELPHGNSGSSYQGNYKNSSSCLGVRYPGNSDSDSSLASSGSARLQNQQLARFTAMMRSSTGGSVAMWNSDVGNNAEKRKGSLLDEFKNNKTRSFELVDIVGHVVEFSMDQYGSRFIQQKLEMASVEEKNKIFPEIVPHACTLMIDVFGNYVIQKFFELGSENQRTELASQLTGHVLALSLQMYGCRVIQKALEVIDVDQQSKIVVELDGSVMKCVRDQNGNHVIQKCIECVPEDRIQFIISAFYGQVVALSTHSYGCRVIQRVLEHCDDVNTHKIIMEEIMQYICTLAQDQYGNYVIQHVLEHGKPDERSAVISQLAGQIVTMSRQKFASNVVEKCLTFSGPEERQLLVKEMLGATDENEPLQEMMKDPYGNYVVQKVLETCDNKSLELLLSRIKVHLNALKRYTYGKHIVSRVEKLITTGEKRIGLSSSLSS